MCKDLNLPNLYQLALFLGLDDSLLNYLNLDSENRFFSNLSDIDAKMIEEEYNLRQILYKNESKDYRNLDTNYEINKIISELKLPEFKFDNKILKARKYQNYHKINKIGDYYGIVYNSPSASEGSYPEKNSIHYYHHDRQYFLISNIYDNIKNLKSINSSIIYKGNPFLRINMGEILSDYDKTINLLLQNFGYKNFVVAGGFIFLRSYKELYTTTSTDLDLFITTKNYDEAIIAIKDIYNAILTIVKSNHKILQISKDILISVNGNALNFAIKVGEKFYINVQVILRLYNSIIQVISGFDIDSCCIAYDGKNLYCMSRFIRSIVHKYNIADPERQSVNYPQRLFKYLQRGINISFPGLDPRHTICNFMGNYFQYTGIAKILTYINTQKDKPIFPDKFSDYEYTPYLLNEEGLYKVLRRVAIADYYEKHIKDKTPSKEVQTEFENLKDYDQNNLQFITEYLNTNNITTPIKFSHSLDYILDSKNQKSNLDNNFNFISSLPDKLEFKIKNAGTQLTNSFNPTMEDWYTDLYVK